MSDNIGASIGIISLAIAFGIGWIAFAVGLSLAEAISKATIRVVWHKHDPNPQDPS